VFTDGIFYPDVQEAGIGFVDIDEDPLGIGDDDADLHIIEQGLKKTLGRDQFCQWRAPLMAKWVVVI
jgi:hypothetical protein